MDGLAVGAPICTILYYHSILFVVGSWNFDVFVFKSAVLADEHFFFFPTLH